MKKSIIFIYATLFLLTVTLGVLIFWNFYPYKTIEFNAPYRTEKLFYTQGDKTYYTVNYCKYTDATAGITKEFIDGLVFTVDSPKPILDPGCRTRQVPMTIPDSLPKGKYQLRNTITYHVNPIRNILITHYSNWFTVNAKEE